MLVVAVNVSKEELVRIAKNELDYISNEYHDDILDMAGFNYTELVDALIVDTRFQNQVAGNVREYGQRYLDDPWDFNSNINLTELARLRLHLEDMRELMMEAIKENEEKTEFAKAVELVQSFGYSVV